LSPRCESLEPFLTNPTRQNLVISPEAKGSTLGLSDECFCDDSHSITKHASKAWIVAPAGKKNQQEQHKRSIGCGAPQKQKPIVMVETISKSDFNFGHEHSIVVF
jgi:hypothetical protein